MKNIIIIFLIFISISTYAQTTIHGGLGLSSHGSGDMLGYGVNFGIEKQIKNRFFIDFATRFTTHSGQHLLMYDDPITGQERNSSYRMVSSGTQIEILPTFKLVNNEGFKLNFRLGAIGRYQVSNAYSGIGFTYLPEYNIPMVSIYNEEGEGTFRKFSVGYLAELGTQFRVSKKSHIGLALILQNDTMGSFIWNLPINYYFTF